MKELDDFDKLTTIFIYHDPAMHDFNDFERAWQQNQMTASLGGKRSSAAI
jgi:hypothetical protein